MATIIEFDRWYQTESQAARDIPCELGTDGWRIIPTAGLYRLRLEIDGSAKAIVKKLLRDFPLLTFGVIESSEDRPRYLRNYSGAL